MSDACQSNTLLTTKIFSEVEIGWAPGIVYMKGVLFQEAHWTPEQAEKLAAHLLAAAEKARQKVERNGR